MTHSRAYRTRESGSVTLFTILILTFLLGLSSAQFVMVQKNLQQANFYASRAALRQYAETGVAMSLQDLRNGNLGHIGTTNWDVTQHDLGYDGVANTNDEGEGDGLPTFGEPNVAPVAVGPAVSGSQLFTHVVDPGIPNVERIVTTAFSDSESVTIERQVKVLVANVPKVGAVYVEPNTTLYFNGNSFVIDGRDHDPNDGSLISGPNDEYGIATAENGGTNAANIVSQIPASRHDQVHGKTGDPSVGEVPPVDIDSLFSAFEAAADQTLPGLDLTDPNASYSNVSWGDWSSSNLMVTHIDGDARLEGQGVGAGVLVIDGDVEIAGQFDFTGLVIVRGSVDIVGGGQGVHIWGSLLATDMVSAIDDVTIGGQADIFYSSAALDAVQQMMNSVPAGYETVYYDEL